VSSFVFIGGHPAIDFLNTEMRVDLLREPEDLAQWIVEAGLGRADHVHAAALRGARELRDAARRLLLAPMRRKDIAILNDGLSRGRGSFRLEIRRGVVQTRFDPEVADPLFLIASAVAEFLSNEDASLVKTCEGAGCVLLFYDTTKNHTRRWCSMAGCGNRMKAALHYRRQREARE
jgi:predicted RNA-binding Zn ribbon-like protein